jgi:hypothetical protein
MFMSIFNFSKLRKWMIGSRRFNTCKTDFFVRFRDLQIIKSITFKKLIEINERMSIKF